MKGNKYFIAFIDKRFCGRHFEVSWKEERIRNKIAAEL